jgi:thioredoxin 1
MALEITDGNIGEILENNKITVIDFWAEWCGPCQILGPIIDELSNENIDIAIGKVNVDNNSVVASEYSIKSIPTLLFFKNGQIVDKVIGMVSKIQLQAKINALK